MDLESIKQNIIDILKNTFFLNDDEIKSLENEIIEKAQYFLENKNIDLNSLIDDIFRNAGNAFKINENDLSNDFILTEDLKAFLSVYNEFNDLLTSQQIINAFENVISKVKCLYPEFNSLENCKEKYPFFMLIAHYVVMQGLSKSIGILPLSGLVASSSVGDVSVNYQASPYSTKGDELVYFLSLTPYGMEYLAWLNRKAGLRIVN